VSSDLPFTINRFFDGEKIGNLSGCSDDKNKSFGKNWGVLIAGPEMLARAVLVLDKNGIIQHVEVPKDVTTEPHYDAAIAVLDRLLAEAAVRSG
jgi:thiol peroxidase